MEKSFPDAVPEVPVSNVGAALKYYETCLGFNIDWGDQNGGIAGVSRGRCRMFLTDRSFREKHGNVGPVVVWLNFNSKAEVNEQHEQWRSSGATIVSAPESKPWMLHEFTAQDLDGNLFRVFYDFSRDV
jgi:uncharacterized glyoxalase superfamily protein PhnB